MYLCKYVYYQIIPMWNLILGRPVGDQGAVYEINLPTTNSKARRIPRLCGIVHVVKRKTGVVRSNSSCMRHTPRRKYTARISRLCGVSERGGSASVKRPIRACGIENPSACDTPRGGRKPHGFRGCQGGVPEIVKGFGDVDSRNHTNHTHTPRFGTRCLSKKKKAGSEWLDSLLVVLIVKDLNAASFGDSKLTTSAVVCLAHSCMTSLWEHETWSF